MLVKRGRLTLRGEPRLAIRDLLGVPGVRVEAVSEAIALEAALIPEAFHGDPADRLIVATAIELRATLVTKDARIQESGLVPTLWPR